MPTIFSHNYKTYINHTDAGGIVYHANHLTFYENCRRDWLTQFGFDSYFLTDKTSNTPNDPIHFVVQHADVHYHHPILLDDVITVHIENFKIKPASIIMTQSIYSNDVLPRLLSKAIITLVCVKHSFEQKLVPIRIPSELIQKITLQ